MNGKRGSLSTDDNKHHQLKVIEMLNLLAQSPHSACFEDQRRVLRDILAHPTSSESSQDMSVGNDKNI